MKTTSIALRTAALAACALAAAAFTGCATNPATGRTQIALISEQQEIAMGREADKEIIASMGLYGNEELHSWIQGLGSSLAARSERPHLPWTFRVVDDPIVNAFALPGGWIYITRGIMSHLSSEAELVSVLGHEIGHVTARHSVERLSKAQLANIGLVAGTILAPEVARSVGGLAETGLGLLFLKFSRDDERQADDLGIRYMLRGGYDPREMPEVFTVLARVGESSGGGGIPSWLSTHPDPGNRSERIEQAVAGLDDDFTNAKVERMPYLRRLDGLVFGDDPRQGYFEENRFFHPEMVFRFDFPRDWKTRNQRQAVVALAPSEDAAMQITLAEAADPRQAAEEFLGQQGIRAGRLEIGKINGLAAAWGLFEADLQGGTLAGRALFVRHGEHTFRLLGYTVEEKWRGYSSAIDSSLQSFARLTDRKVLSVQPARLELVTLDREMTLEEFYRRHPSTVPIETIALINHAQNGDSFPRGTLLKRVVGGPGE